MKSLVQVIVFVMSQPSSSQRRCTRSASLQATLAPSHQRGSIPSSSHPAEVPPLMISQSAANMTTSQLQRSEQSSSHPSEDGSTLQPICSRNSHARRPRPQLVEGIY